jgi:hypothetical protein
LRGGADVRGVDVCGARDHPPLVRQSAERPAGAAVEAGRSWPSRRGLIARLGRVSGRPSRTNGSRVDVRAPAYDARDAWLGARSGWRSTRTLTAGRIGAPRRSTNRAFDGNVARLRPFTTILVLTTRATGTTVQACHDE